jgi:hypothetical protein
MIKISGLGLYFCLDFLKCSFVKEEHVALVSRAEESHRTYALKMAAALNGVTHEYTVIFIITLVRISYLTKDIINNCLFLLKYNGFTLQLDAYMLASDAAQ